MAVLDVPSPCVSVRVKIMEEGQPRAEVAVMPSGKINLMNGSSASLPSFVKGKTYKLQATCISTARVFQNTELNFKADGRTVMVVFTKSGFQFRRGSVAY